jgi:hypothetical protein
MCFDAIQINRFFRDNVVFPHWTIVPGLKLAHRAYAPRELRLGAQVPVPAKSDKPIRNML